MKYLLLLLLFLFSCTHSTDKNHANKHMHKRSHQELIARFEDPQRDEWQKPLKVLELMGNLADKNVIDIGSGGGYFTKYFIPRSKSVTAADVDRIFLNFVADRFSKESKLQTRLIEYADPKMREGEFDLAFNANTYHHIENRVSYFKKVHRGLASKGRLMIVDFKASQKKSSFGPPASMRIKSSVVVHELQAAGFNNLSVDEQTLEHQYIILGHKD